MRKKSVIDVIVSTMAFLFSAYIITSLFIDNASDIVSRHINKEIHEYSKQGDKQDDEKIK